MSPNPRPEHHAHVKPCRCDPCQRDLIGALCWVFRSGAEVAIAAEMSELEFVRLARVCYRWEKTGEIPRSANEDDGTGPPTVRP